MFVKVFLDHVVTDTSIEATLVPPSPDAELPVGSLNALDNIFGALPWKEQKYTGRVHETQGVSKAALAEFPTENPRYRGVQKQDINLGIATILTCFVFLFLLLSLLLSGS